MNEGTLQCLLLLHAFVTVFMVGVIWFVQVVHYPLFASVPHADFACYERRNTRRTAWVVVVPMLLELGLSVLLVWSHGGPLAWSGLGLLGVIWLSTAVLQVPLHQHLEMGFEPSIHRRLVRSNWVRTVCWTLRGIIALLMLVGG